MKKKLKFILPLVVLLLLGGVYKVVLAKPAKAEKSRVETRRERSHSTIVVRSIVREVTKT